MEAYAHIKTVHVALAGASVAWLVARGIAVIWMGKGPGGRLGRVGPHVVDTALLATGVWLAVMAGWRPWVHPWLGVKLTLLLAYIGLAWAALKPWLGRRARMALFMAALAVFLWMAGAAVTKSPMGPLILLGS